MLLAWFEKSTTSDFTVQDLINKMKTWFSEGYLYDDVWETLRETIDKDLLPSKADVKNMTKEGQNKRMSSGFRQAVRHPVTWAVLVVLIAIAVSLGELH